MKACVHQLISKAFNLSAIKGSRIPWVDYIKGISILLIVYRHVLIGIERSGFYVPSYIMTINMIFFSFRLPLFFILSGMFLNISFLKRTVKQFVENKFEVLLYPYFIWATLQITLQIALSSFTNSNRNWIDYTYLFYQPREIDQFWYLPAIFNVTMIYSFIKYRLKTSRYIQLSIGLVLYFLAPHFQQISILSDWMLFYLFFAIGDFISKFFFRDSWQNIFKNSYALIVVVPLFVGSQIYYLAYNLDLASTRIDVQLQFIAIVLIGCFSMIFIAFKLQSLHILFYLRILGYHSLYIYVLHVLVSSFVRVVLIRVLKIHNVEVLLITGIAIAVTGSVVIYNLFIRNGIAWFLFTYRKPKDKPAITFKKDITSAAVTS